MEKTNNRIQEKWEKKPEVIGIHPKAILGNGIADAREVNKRMDALCMDEEIAKRVLWEDIYNQMKPKLQPTKKFIHPENDEEIMALPAFKEFLQEYTISQQKLQQEKAQKEQAEELKSKLIEKPIMESINDIKEMIRKVVGEKAEKTEGKRKTFYEFMKSSQIDDEKKKEYKEKMNQFIFDHLLKSNERRDTEKKKKTDELYKEFTLEGIRSRINNVEKERSKKISTWIEKIKGKLQPAKIEEKDYTKDAIMKFRERIGNNSAIRNEYYLPEDGKDIEHIQEYFKKHLKETIPSPDMSMIQKEGKEGMMEKKGDQIRISTNDYTEITNRGKNFKKRFTEEHRNPREYLFDRLIEYAGMDILKHEIDKSITANKEKVERYEIYKTDPLDDSSAGTDYIVLFKFKGEERARIAPIDLFISDKREKTNASDEETDTSPESWSLEEKKGKAKTTKIPYSTYLHLFWKSTQTTYQIKKIERYVEQQSPSLTYAVLKGILQNKHFDTEHFLNERDEKRKYESGRHQETEKNICRELVKIAA